MRCGRSRAQLDIGDDSLGSQPPEKPATTLQAAQFDNRIAGVFRRMLACFIDLLFLSLVAFACASLINEFVAPAVRFARTGELVVNQSLVSLYGIVIFLLNAGYFSIAWRVLRATPGQMRGAELAAERDRSL